MLKYRLLTAFLMGPLILWAIYVMPEDYFALFSLLLITLGAREWSDFSGLNNSVQRVFFIIGSLLLFVTVLVVQNESLNLVIISLSLLWWLICIPLLRFFPFDESNIINTKVIKILTGIVLLLATLVSMVLIRNNPNYGSEFVLYLILMIWFADSGAYFAGRAFGRTKLIPNVSPGKTWEGVIGALVITLVVAYAGIKILNIPSSQSLAFVLLTFVTVIYSIVGDLSESMFKRMANIKDSGHILPGHGGILDRIDSLMSGFPVFFAGLWIMEKFI